MEFLNKKKAILNNLDYRGMNMAGNRLLEQLQVKYLPELTSNLIKIGNNGITRSCFTIA